MRNSGADAPSANNFKEATTETLEVSEMTETSKTETKKRGFVRRAMNKVKSFFKKTKKAIATASRKAVSAVKSGFASYVVRPAKFVGRVVATIPAAIVAGISAVVIVVLAIVSVVLGFVSGVLARIIAGILRIVVVIVNASDSFWNKTRAKLWMKSDDAIWDAAPDMAAAA